MDAQGRRLIAIDADDMRAIDPIAGDQRRDEAIKAGVSRVGQIGKDDRYVELEFIVHDDFLSWVGTPARAWSWIAFSCYW